MRLVPLLIAAASLIGVLAVVAWEWRQRRSPGPLHPSHAAVVRLNGTAGCDECHGSANQPTMGIACASCHQEIRAQLDAARGLHGRLVRGTADRCAACHPDHAGSSIALVSDQSFRASGFPGANRTFDHGKIGKYLLTGRHAQLTCEQCHPHAHAPMLVEGQKRFLGLAQQCERCHKDVHEGTFGRDCNACHGQEQPFKAAPLFVHTAQFPLTAVHAKLACTKCHDKTGGTSVQMLMVGTHPVRACVSCHKDPHEGAYGADCAWCHGTEKTFKQSTTFAHTDAFPLTGSHAGLACNDCHEKSGPHSVAALRLAKLPVRGCESCHESPHRSTMVKFVAASISPAGSDVCAQCHRNDDKSFLSPPATMTARQHQATGFPLDPPHDNLKCVQCHKDIGHRQPLPAGPNLAARYAALFPGRTLEDCAACHADPHRAQFASGGTGGRCVACHATTHFAPATFDLARHEHTNFPLTGAHRAVACAACHKKDAAGVVRYVPTATACSSCHADAHGGRFEQPPLPSVVDGRRDCARCHSTDTFADTRWTAQDHAAWTGYALSPPHAAAKCRDCHPRQSKPDAQGRSFGVAAKTCVACHTDVHAGQFAVNGSTDCTRCHTDQHKLTDTTFDHQRDSRFKLDAVHVKLACAACHRPVEVAPNVKVIRFRPLGVRCQDCHGAGFTGGKESRP
jgi:predicted CXXCH cytochrome family protein